LNECSEPSKSKNSRPIPVFTQYTHLNEVETSFGLVHQKLDDQPNILYVGSFFVACMVFPAQPFQTAPCPLKRHA